MKQAWKVIKIVLLVLLGLILAAVAVISVFASKNVKEMNACVEETIAAVAKDHKLTEVDSGEFSEMKLFGILKFHIKQYDVEDFGNLSVMTVNAGVMQMATFVFSPFEKDLPLLSCDYMYMLSTRKAYVEFYDLVAEKNHVYMAWMDRYEDLRTKYADLSDSNAASGWYDEFITVAIYKDATNKEDARIRGLLNDAVTTYMKQTGTYRLLEESEVPAKVARIKAYSDRLIDEGGISTSFFVSVLGEDTTRAFFDQVFFGTAHYQK